MCLKSIEDDVWFLLIQNENAEKAKMLGMRFFQQYKLCLFCFFLNIECYTEAEGAQSTYYDTAQTRNELSELGQFHQLQL